MADPMFVTRTLDGKYVIGNGLGRRGVAPDDLEYIIKRRRAIGCSLINYGTGDEVDALDQVTELSDGSVRTLGVKVE